MGRRRRGRRTFVEADPADPQKLVGFDVEIAELIARELGRQPEFVQVAFTSLDQSAARGDFDIGLSGIEDTPARRATLAASLPHYRFTEQLTVRDADRDRYRTLADLRGRRVATLGGTIAYELLLAAEREHGIIAVSHDDDVHPHTDTLNGRVDAVLLDNVLADRAMRRNAGLFTSPGRWRPGTTSSSPVRRIARSATTSIACCARRWVTAGSKRSAEVAGMERRPARALCQRVEHEPGRSGASTRRARSGVAADRRHAALSAGAVSRAGIRCCCRAWR